MASFKHNKGTAKIATETKEPIQPVITCSKLTLKTLEQGAK